MSAICLQVAQPVFDLSGLRLHPDGTRVPQISKARKPQAAVGDSRGNWIATDAGGSGPVKKKRRARKRKEREDEEGEVFDFSGVDASDEDRTRKKWKGKGKARQADDEPEPRVTRATKRRNFVNDLQYLSAQEEEECQGLPGPSAELLMWIHHFASNYYRERGQLFNASSQYCKQKKHRQLERTTERSASDNNEENDDDAMTGSEEYDNDAEASDISSNSERSDKNALAKDMYKLMDGSALIAIGMLLQEHIAGMLIPSPPSDWEEEVGN